jgi:hypothetical protein
MAFRFMSLIGESFVGSIGDDLADSFFGSVDNIVLMY